jgi:PiT family inorganic phosphate transporter
MTMELDIILLLGFGITFYVAWGIGANDETMALLSGSGLVSVRVAALLGAVMAFLGTIFLGQNVEETIGKGLLLETVSSVDALVILFSIATWLVVASYRGWPVSTTHSAVGAVLGLGLVKWGIAGVNWAKIAEIAVFWVLSPIVGMVSVILLVKLVSRLLRNSTTGLRRELKVTRSSAVLLLIWSCISSFSRGANDISNATAFLGVVIDAPLLVRTIGGGGLMLGLLVLGRRVLKSVGRDLVKLDPVMALSVEVAVALITLVSTLAGLPVSGTHILIGAIIGVGTARGIWINIKGLKEILFTWLATFPFAAVVSMTVAFLVFHL